MEDEVGEGLGHGAYVGDVVPHHHVVQSEVGGGPERQVAHHQAVWKHTRRKPLIHTLQNGAGFGVYPVRLHFERIGWVSIPRYGSHVHTEKMC